MGVGVGQATRQKLRLHRNLRKSKLKSPPRGNLQLSNKSFALIHGNFLLLCLLRLQQLQRRGPKEGDEVGAEWQGGEQVRPGLPH